MLRKVIKLQNVSLQLNNNNYGIETTSTAGTAEPLPAVSTKDKNDLVAFHERIAITKIEMLEAV